ncbi:MAG: hypothetical protein JNL58_01145 [Planctomyces sp.]|nr:hypothetical protein [Planctomyces sp.]
MSTIEVFEKSLRDRGYDSVSGDLSASDVLDALESTLLIQKDYHRLFDALLIRVRVGLHLPVTKPTSLADVPADAEQAFRSAYMAAARKVGQHFLDDGRLADAWAYFRTIGEPEPVRRAIEAVQIPAEPDTAFDEILNLALYEGAHVVRGLEFLLKTHGTCNTITAMSQLMPQMTQDERRRAAAIMVKHLYTDLQYSLARDVTARGGSVPDGTSIAAMLLGGVSVFEGGNYHIDVSHLHATVGFARHLRHGDSELELARELAVYGGNLSSQLRYPADVPFDDYYTASLHFLNALAGHDTDQAFAYFVDRLRNEPDAPDQRLIAFVLIDLGQRIGRLEQALEIGGEHLSRLEDPSGFSFSTCCVEAGRTDLLEQNARRNDDVLGLVTSLLSK